MSLNRTHSSRAYGLYSHVVCVSVALVRGPVCDDFFTYPCVCMHSLVSVARVLFCYRFCILLMFPSLKFIVILIVHLPCPCTTDIEEGRTFPFGVAPRHHHYHDNMTRERKRVRERRVGWRIEIKMSRCRFPLSIDHHEKRLTPIH